MHLIQDLHLRMNSSTQTSEALEGKWLLPLFWHLHVFLKLHSDNEEKRSRKKIMELACPCMSLDAEFRSSRLCLSKLFKSWGGHHSCLFCFVFGLMAYSINDIPEQTWNRDQKPIHPPCSKELVPVWKPCKNLSWKTLAPPRSHGFFPIDNSSKEMHLWVERIYSSLDRARHAISITWWIHLQAQQCT